MDRTRRTTLLVFLLLLLGGVVAGVALLGDLRPEAPGPGDAARRRPEGDRDRDRAVADGGEQDGTAADTESSRGDADPSASTEEAPDGGEGEDEEEFSYETETAFPVRVRVLDHAGEPVEATVEILDPRYEWSFGEMPGVATGVFRGHLPEAGRYDAVADRSGTRMRVPFAVAGGTTEVEVRFAGTGSVSGTIFTSVGAVDGGVHGKRKVIGQADLSVELIPDREPRDGPGPRLSCRVGESATYRVESVPPGEYLVCLRNKFHVSRVTVGDGEDVVHDVQLGGGRIAGRVTDRDSGEPLANVQVVLQPGRGERENTPERRRAGFARASHRVAPDEDGRYAFTNLPAGEYSLFSNGTEHAPSHATATVGRDFAEVRLDFALERGSFVDIAVTDLDDRPLEAPLWVTQGILCGFTGKVSGLRAGTHDFLAWAPGHELQRRPAVEFRPGEATKLRFRLAPAARTRLVFRDGAGQPLEGARVSVLVDGRDIQPVLASLHRGQAIPFSRTGADGVAEIRGVKAGPVRVVAKKSGFAVHDGTVTLKAGTEEVVVPLESADTEFVWRVRVTKVTPDGPAARLGLRVGDVLVRYDGRAIESVREFTAAVEAAKTAGKDDVALLIERDGETFEVRVAPGVLGVSLDEFEVTRGR